MDLSKVLAVGDRSQPFGHPALPAIADATAAARRCGAAIILLMGAHVIKQGLSRYVIDLVRRGSCCLKIRTRTPRYGLFVKRSSTASV